MTSTYFPLYNYRDTEAEIMVKPLTFKGDKPKKRKQRDHDSEPSRKAAKSSTTSESQQEKQQQDDADENTEDQSWVTAEASSDLAGPVLLVLPSEDPLTAIAADANGKVFASTLENTLEGDPGTAEPHDVRQVWVATRVAGTEAFSFRGAHGKYLGFDSHGLPSATASAISHHESFLVIPSGDIPGTFAMQIHGGDKESFVSISGGGTDGGKAVEIRGDATSLSFNTTLRIRMQARFKPRIKATKEHRAMEKISRKELEGIVGRRLEDDEVKRLRRARRDGNFHEEVLDVKVKGKHDKFA